MTQVGPGPPHDPETASERVAALILQSVERASQAILDAATKAAADIADSATKVPTALSTPAVNGYGAEELVRAFETMQGHNGQGPTGDPFNDGVDLGYDPDLDILVDSTGTRWNPNPGDEPAIPSPYRESFDIVPPGTPLVPQLPRLDT